MGLNGVSGQVQRRCDLRIAKTLRYGLRDPEFRRRECAQTIRSDRRWRPPKTVGHPAGQEALDLIDNSSGVAHIRNVIIAIKHDQF